MKIQILLQAAKTPNSGSSFIHPTVLIVTYPHVTVTKICYLYFIKITALVQDVCIHKKFWHLTTKRKFHAFTNVCQGPISTTSDKICRHMQNMLPLDKVVFRTFPAFIKMLINSC